MSERLLILDFGSQYTHLISAVLSSLAVPSMIEPADIDCEEFLQKSDRQEIKGIILTGGAQSVFDEAIAFDHAWLVADLPVLGICYGHQLIARLAGGRVERSVGEYGRETVHRIKRTSLNSGLPFESVIWVSHNDKITTLPPEYESTESTLSDENTGIQHKVKKIYGLQYHPEVSHTVGGSKILENFAFNICKIERQTPWQPSDFIKQATQHYREVIGDKKVVTALSGGVDSTVLATLLRKFLPKEQLLEYMLKIGRAHV